MSGNYKVEQTNHGLFQFEVVGYRVEDRSTRDPHILTQGFVTIEGRRQYHIGCIYKHKPDQPGVEYRTLVVPGFSESGDVAQDMYNYGFTKLQAYMEFKLNSCPYCNPPRGEVELIEKDLKPYKPLRYEKVSEPAPDASPPEIEGLS